MHGGAICVMLSARTLAGQVDRRNLVCASSRWRTEVGQSGTERRRYDTSNVIALRATNR